jgi:hypothetical protein
MVNLIKFREKALYPETSAPAWGDDPMEANARYSRAMVPWLLKHGGHPIFGTVVAGRFIDDTRGEAWDQVLAVRYRSRRDMLKMVIDLAGKGIEIHKWASIEKTRVFPVKPFLSLVFVRTSVAIVLAAVGALLVVLW